ncbi:hypothetical protein GF345_05820 [Candidatus Woesearchaeota archaeon]|nr:hypothetical protein [Candidatus Woesearchaeota archaeon]
MAKKESGFSQNYAIYTYDISDLEPSKRVRFVYALKGRGDEKGLIEELGGIFLVPGCFRIPAAKSREIDSVFRLWKVRNKRYKALMD